MDIVSVQSRVAWGYVGNAVAVPIIQSLGEHAWPIDTVTLSHHPGHGPSNRRLITASDLRAQMHDVFMNCANNAHLLMGYLGDVAQGEAALAEWQALPRHGKIYLDPAFGDDAEGIYVDPEIAAFHKQTSMDAANVMMANAFESAHIAGHDISSIEEAIAAADIMLRRNPNIVLMSSVPKDADTIATVLATPDGVWVTETERRDLRAKGTGDLLSAAFTALHASGAPPESALSVASAIVDDAVLDAANAQLSELNLPGVMQRLTTGQPHLDVRRIKG